MRRARVAVLGLMVAAFFSVSVEAGVRDPISRKFQPEKGFFETKPSGSSSRSSATPSAGVRWGAGSQSVSKPQGKVGVPKKSFPWRSPWSR